MPPASQLPFLTYPLPGVMRFWWGEDGPGPGDASGLRLPAWPNAISTEALFKNDLASVYTADFEDLPAYQNGATLVFGDYTVGIISGGGFINYIPTGTNGAGRYPVTGNQYYDWTAATIYVEFSTEVVAFGFYTVDVGDWDGSMIIHLEGSIVAGVGGPHMAVGFLEVASTATGVSGPGVEFTVPHHVSGIGLEGGAVGYIGMESKIPFKRMSIKNTAPGLDFFALDALTVSGQLRTGLVF